MLQIDVWSDIACPWCAIGKRRLETALADFPHRDEVVVRWRSFQLDPNAPRVVDTDGAGGGYAERLARKYRTSVGEAQAMMDRMAGLAADEGWSFRFDRLRAGNTFDAHRVLHLARDLGRQDAAKERLLAAYFEEGAPIGRPEELHRLAVEAGLDPDAVDEVLASDRYADEVRADEQAARELGITGVPFFLFDGRYAAPGAQPADVLRRILDRVWPGREPVLATAPGHAHGPGCADGSCSI